MAEAMRWHQRLGHPGPETLEHLVACSEGVRICGPTTVECEACGESKAKRQIYRQRRKFLKGPGERLALDFYNFQKGYDRYTTLMLVTDR